MSRIDALEGELARESIFYRRLRDFFLFKKRLIANQSSFFCPADEGLIERQEKGREGFVVSSLARDGINACLSIVQRYNIYSSARELIYAYRSRR